jgi:deazaflavin-dependent oxidoreductase (nitroreductase family)
MDVNQFDWHKMKPAQKLHKFLYAIGLGPLVGQIVLILTTTGRKSGLQRTTPLQYEKINGQYYVGAARGLKADWVKNIEANPRVQVRVKWHDFSGTAQVCHDPGKIADFLQIRLKHHPLMMGLIMEKAHQLPRKPNRTQLERIAAEEVMIIITAD